MRLPLKVEEYDSGTPPQSPRDTGSNSVGQETLSSKLLPSFLELKSRPDDPELEFIKSISQIAKQYMGEEWDKNSKEDVLAFEQAIHLVIAKYKDVANEKSEKAGHSGSKFGAVSGSGSKKFDMSALQRAVSKQQGALGGKPKEKELKVKAVNAYFLNFEFQESQSPRSRTICRLGDVCMLLLGSLTSYIAPFQKYGIVASSMEPFLKDNGEIGKHHAALAGQIIGIVVEITNNMIPPSQNPDSPLGRLFKRVNDVITTFNLSVWNEQVLVDQKLFGQGQYLKSLVLALVETVIKEIQHFENSTLRMFNILKGLNIQDVCTYLVLLAHLHYYANVLKDLLQDFATLISICKKHHQQENERPAQPYFPNDDGQLSEKERNDTDTDKFRPGTLPGLIVRLTQPGAEELFPVFWTGFEAFSSAAEIFDKLRTRYRASNQESVKSQVAEVLLHWVDHEVYTIDTGTLREIERFSQENLRRNECTNTFTSLNSKLALNKFVVRNALNDNLNVRSLWVSQLPSYSVLMSAHAQTIAEQLTRIGSEAYNRITPCELINLKWSKDKLKVLSRNVVDMISQPNMLSHFVATSILLQRKKMDRTKMITQVIMIGKAFLDLNNFNGLMGVLAGLSMSAVSRLRHSFAKLSESTNLILQQLQGLQDPSQGSKKLREAMGQASQALPYIGLSLTDLTFMDEGNPTHLDEEKRTVNFPKFQMINRTIKLLLQFQNSSFFNGLTPVQPLYAFLSEMSNLNENELWELSNEREPKGCAYKDIE